jgi:hypothetical protein
MIAAKHPAMEAFRRVPHPWWVHSVPLLMIFPPLVLWLLYLQFIIGTAIGDIGSGPGWLIFHILPLIGALAISWLVAVGGTYVCSALLRYRDRRRLGPARDDEVYVGIAYADGFWNYRNDHAWDRGYLRATQDGLVFRGQGTEFALPAHAIRDVRPAASRATAGLNIPRVFVDWESPDGAVSTLSLDGRSIPAFGMARRANVAITEYLQKTLRLSAHDPLRAIWPPALNPHQFVLATRLRITTSDRLITLVLSCLAGSAAVAAFYPYLRALELAAPPIAAGFFVIAYMAISGVVLNRRIGQRLEEASQDSVELPRVADAPRIPQSSEDVHLRA